MEYRWLNHKNNNKLILFFNGWGMNESAIEHLLCEDYDVLMFYNYNSLSIDLDFAKYYTEINLVSWSMGVFISGMVLNPILSRLNRITFINGTLKPIDEKYGISPKIYDLTVRFFSDESAEKFVSNMFSDRQKHKIKLREPISDLKNELIALQKYTEENISSDKIVPTKIYISNKDRIIPSKHQSAYWNTEPNTEGEHYIFDKFTKWSELL